MEHLLSQFDTPGKIVTINTGSLFVYDGTGKYKLNNYILDPNNTYINIFLDCPSDRSQIQYKYFLESPHKKIIWTSSRAINKRIGHGKAPRNVVVVWEYVLSEENE